MDKEVKKVAVKAKPGKVTNKTIKEAEQKLETYSEIKTKDNSIYCLYLDIKEYVSLLDKSEYVIEEDGRVLLGKYRDKQLAMNNTLKYINRGLLVSLVVI
ncbi:hypothetical protein [Clostridium saudiense]|uniref:hypothetical protein n=1 Tax=Clostridium saudiense TaxID=1414720 RepID=UPI00266F6C89|nr:hypothetical protein [Clostridium saudiense]